MQSTASLGGHPIHAILVAFPIALLVTVFLSDLVYLKGRDPFWARCSYVLLVMGLVWTLLAALPGLVDFLTMPMAPISKWHLGVGLTIAVVSAVHLWRRKPLELGAVPPVLITLSAFTLLLIGVQGFLGGELVYRYHVGVIPTPQPRTADHAVRSSKGGAIGTEAHAADKNRQGTAVFDKRCSGCHSLNGAGGDMGPALTHEGSRRDKQWLVAQIKSPRSHNPKGQMPVLEMSDADRDAVASFLASSK